MKFEGVYKLTTYERQLLRNVQVPLVSDRGVRLSKPCVVALDLADGHIYGCFSVAEWRRMLKAVPGFYKCYTFELVNLY